MKTAVVVGVVVTLHLVVAITVFLSPGCRSPQTRTPERQIAVMPEPVVVTPVPVRPEPRPTFHPPVPVAPVVSVQPPADHKEYVVLPGDIISRIAQRTGVSVAEIIELNRLSDPNRITVGQTLLLPAHARISAPATSPSVEASAPPVTAPLAGGSAATYEVQPGDVLSRVALRYGVSMAAIMQANQLADPNHIRVGQKLIIPGGARVPAARVEASPPRAETPARSVPDSRAITPSVRETPPNAGRAIHSPMPLDADLGALLESSAADLTYVVEQGETLEGIAMMYGKSADELQRYNNLSSRHLVTGQTLKIPRD